MEMARLVGLVAGILIVLATAWNVFTALVLPRVTSSRTTRAIARVLGGAARRISPHLPTYELRDRMLSFVGPASMVALFGLWLLLLVLGFGLIIWWNAGIDYASALGIAGSSVFTLGIASARGAGPHTLEILAAGVGLLVIALEIAYLPALYNAFAVRETEVTLLEARGGAPAWGPRSSPGATGSRPWTSSRRCTPNGSVGPPPSRRAMRTTRASSGSAHPCRAGAG